MSLHSHHHADGHAAFTRGAKAGVDGGVGSQFEVGVGQDQHVVLRAAQGLDPLAVAGGGLVDVLGDRGGSDEGNRLDVQVLQEPIDGFLVAMKDVEHTIREARLGEEGSEPVGRRRVLFARLQHHGVAGRNGDRQEPQRHHGGEVEGADDAHHAQRRLSGVNVDAGGDVL
jgi:hypothetical protein